MTRCPVQHSRARASRVRCWCPSGQSLNQVWSHMKVRPLHDRLIVQRLDEGEQTVGSIIVPDTRQGEAAAGQGLRRRHGKVKEDGSRQQPDVKDGDTILFGKYSGQEIKIDGEEYLIMREDDVLAIIDSKIEDGADQWQNRSCTASSRGRPSCAASTSWRTRSRSLSVRRAATSSSTRSSAPPPSPRMA